jgi:DNA-binding CsgD family transcriptional regulator
VAYLAPTSERAGLVAVLLRRRGFTAGELGRLRALEAGVCAGLRLHAEACGMARAGRSTDAKDLHRRVEAALDRFGSTALTPREAEVVRLLLRGHSTKAAAERLGIAAATTALHRKRAYAKLGVRSQAQLFHRFIQSLAGAPHAVPAPRRVGESSRAQVSPPPLAAGLS